ncbi:unnamed protein product [Didymodactylos carnosus]|uniref:Uncharacterized protein n=1 Tax=Didymodactylos carnosus TaxID=1234261 RepID=A0A814VYZ2_9BILA|nr:unnamed protein product [Didymodactylos carnosus]CAF3958189.1 unnamed protein product [Didymodactylos carnosus]
MCLVSKVSVERQDDEIQCLIDNLAQQYQNALFPPTSEIDLSSNVAPVDVYSTIPEHQQNARQENESTVLTNIDQILTKTSINVNTAQYTAAFASNENGSAIDLFIVLFTMNPSTAAAVLDIFEVLAAAANCSRSITQMGSIKSPAHAGPNITNEDPYPLFTLDAKR